MDECSLFCRVQIPKGGERKKESDLSWRDCVTNTKYYKATLTDNI